MLPPSAKFVQLFDFCMQNALNQLKLIANKCMDSRALMSKTLASGVESLQPVVLKFTKNKRQRVDCSMLPEGDDGELV